MILKVFGAFLFSVLMFSCTSQNLEIDGRIEDLETDTLYFIKYLGQNDQAVAVRVKNGSFYFKDHIEEPVLMRLAAKGKMSEGPLQVLTQFLAEPGRVIIRSKTSIPDSIKIDGLTYDPELKKYLREDQLLGKRWDDIKAEYENCKVARDTICIRIAIARLDSINFQAVSLLKSYVKKHHDNMLGALLPNFCTLSNVLSKEDYLEIYTMLSANMQRTAYGKEIYSKIR